MLKLRPLETNDFNDVVALFTDENVRKYLGGAIELTQAQDRAKKVVQKSPNYIHVIEYNGNMIGTIMFGTHTDTDDCEVSYQLLPKYWGLGHAQQALKLALSQIKGKVVAETQAGNQRSRKLLQRLGFKEVRTLERFNEAQVLCELIC